MRSWDRYQARWIGFVVAPLGQVLAALEDTGVNPGARRCGSVVFEVGNAIHRLSGCKVEAADLFQYDLGAAICRILPRRFLNR